MGSYIEAIRTLEKESRALQDALHLALRSRQDSPHKYKDWERATERFRTYRSDLDTLIDRCWPSTGDIVDPHLREFMFDYILIDPQFFRSGYIMEKVLQRVKRLSLTAEEKGKVRDLLLNRIHTKALRNFRNICRLIPVIEESGLREAIGESARSADPSVRHRVEFALTYFRG